MGHQWKLIESTPYALMHSMRRLYSLKVIGNLRQSPFLEPINYKKMYLTTQLLK